MNKIKNLIKKKYKVIISFFLGMFVAGTTVFAATYYFKATDTTYTNSNSTLSSTNVNDALDELYNKTKAMVNTGYISIFSNLKFSSNKKIMASNYMVCIDYYANNYSVVCFKYNNFNVEKYRIRRVFGSGACTVTGGNFYASNDPGTTTKVSCTANNFTCEVQKTGYVYCGTAGKSCYISSGTATCN
ncbi:MAG: hypothetical protein IIZ40_02845 [Bacilli bacterium]|nr:hypothetical protein [Bacilli bacterium]